MGSFFGAAAEPEREQGAPVVGHKIDFPTKGDVSILRAAIALIECIGPGQQLPAVGQADIADGTCKPGYRGGKRQRYALPSGRKQHRGTLVVAGPACIAGARIREMRCDKDIQTIVG